MREMSNQGSQQGGERRGVQRDEYIQYKGRRKPFTSFVRS